PLALPALGGDLRGEAARLARLPLLADVARLIGHAHLDGHDEFHLELAGLRAGDRAADLLDLEPAQRTVHRILALLGLHLRAHLRERCADGVADARARRAHALD